MKLKELTDLTNREALEIQGGNSTEKRNESIGVIVGKGRIIIKQKMNKVKNILLRDEAILLITVVLTIIGISYWYGSLFETIIN